MQHFSDISNQEFTQYLLSVFLSNCDERNILRLPPNAPIVMQAACFCHTELKSRGFVCSVCLTCFCRDPVTQGQYKCPACNSRIQTPGETAY